MIEHLIPSHLFGLSNCILIIATAVVARILFKQRQKAKAEQFSASIKGPESLPFFGNSLTLIKSKNAVKDIAGLTSAFGSPYKLRIGSHLYIVLASPEHIEAFFRNSKAIGKTNLFNKFKTVFGESIFTSTGDIWKTKRRYFLRTINGQRLLQAVPLFQEESTRFVNELKSKVNGDEFNLWDCLSYLTFDIISKAGANVTLSSEVKSQIQFHEIMKNMLVLNFKRLLCPWYHNDVIGKCVLGSEINKNKEKLQLLLEKALEGKHEHLQNLLKTVDFKNEASIEGYSYLETAYVVCSELGQKDAVCDEAVTALSAGTVNIATVLGTILLMIAMHPDVQKKLQNELDDVFGDDERDVTAEDMQNLPYLDQVFKETLRRFTLVPLILRSLEKDLQLDNLKIPSGTNIAISIAGVHYSPKYYSDPWTFNPDHFSVNSVSSRPKYAFIPFAAGPRDCLGKAFATLEIKIILVTLLRAYSFHTSTKMSEISLNYSFLVTSTNGYNVRIKGREKI